MIGVIKDDDPKKCPRSQMSGWDGCFSALVEGLQEYISQNSSSSGGCAFLPASSMKRSKMGTVAAQPAIRSVPVSGPAVKFELVSLICESRIAGEAINRFKEIRNGRGLIVGLNQVPWRLSKAEVRWP